MRRQHIDVRSTSSADAHTIYGLLRDGSTWPAWSPIESFELERAGADEREGIGAIRIFRRGRVLGRDEVAGFAPDHSFSYRLLSGLPVRDYTGAVELSPAVGGGTVIRWQSSFRPRLPGTGWLYRRGIGRMLQRSADGLAGYAARLARTTGSR